MANTEKKGEGATSGDHSVDASLARHGGLSYLEIPAVDVRRSATFYEKICGWKVERRDANDFRFGDATGHLIGRWTTSRGTFPKPGLLPYIYVNRIREVVEKVPEYGGEVIKAPYAEGNLLVATVRDPAGNVIGLWEATSEL